MIWNSGALDLTSDGNTVVSRKNCGFSEVIIWVYGDKQQDIQDTLQEISRFIKSKVLKQDITIGQNLVPNITAEEVRETPKS